MKMNYLIPALLTGMLVCSCTTQNQGVFPTVEDLSESVYASGQIKARNQYQAYANASGIIKEIYLTEGDTVKIGTPILTIQNETTRITRQKAELSRAYSDRQANQSKLLDLEINIQNANTKYQNDSLLYFRQRRLREQGIGSAIELEQRQLAFENSKAALASAKLRLEDLKRELEFNEKSAINQLASSRAVENDLVLRSEVDGILFGMLKEKGELVSPQTQLAILGTTNFYMELQVDEIDIAKIKIGQKVLVSMDSYRGQTFEAKVTKINPIMDERSKTFLIEAEYTSIPEVLYPNLSLEANIIIQNKQQVLTLPRSYIINDSYVIAVSGDTLPVKLGLKDYAKAEVMEGIDKSTAVIKP
jgi:HlyD family secretion protein